MANNGAAVAQIACRYDPALSYSLSIHGSAEFFHVDSWRLAEKAEGAVFVRCISNFCRAQVMAWTRPEFWGGMRVVHCGLDLGDYPPRPPREGGPLRLVAVGRFHPIKGYPLLLDACGLAARSGVDLRLTLVGGGPMDADLRKRAEGMGELVRFTGPLSPEGVAAELDRSDAMVVSSFMEGVPVVLMEAMAKELGVVATRVGGIPELVEDGVSGLIVDPGSPEALAAAIRRYAVDPGLCRRHGAEGRRRVAASFTAGGTAEGMLGLFREHAPACCPAEGKGRP
jgi:glycosyltransferase involved in cell wall biosynthesis